jgi:hypothetical protein
VGIGVGTTRTWRTAYNAEGALSSSDLNFQAGARVFYRLSKSARVFAGYRFMRVASSKEPKSDGRDDDDDWYDYGNWDDQPDWVYRNYGTRSSDPDSPRRDTPHLNAHALEIGVSFVF